MAAGLVVVLLSGCVPEVTDPVADATTPEGAPSTTPAEAGTTTAAPQHLALQRAREDLAEPVIELAQSTMDVARRVDFIRHEVDRGPAMRQAIADVDALMGPLEDDAAAAELAVADMDGVLQPTRDAVEGLVALSRDVLADVARETAALLPVVHLDLEMASVVERWDEPGSRSEAAAQLTDLAAEAEALRDDAHRLQVIPDDCPDPRLNRIRWAEVVVQRTAQLRDAALAADGPAYDQLLAEFQAQPYGEDRVAADAGSRDCWAAHTSLPDVGSQIDRHLAAVEEALGS